MNIEFFQYRIKGAAYMSLRDREERHRFRMSTQLQCVSLGVLIYKAKANTNGNYHVESYVRSFL